MKRWVLFILFAVCIAFTFSCRNNRVVEVEGEVIESYVPDLFFADFKISSLSYNAEESMKDVGTATDSFIAMLKGKQAVKETAIKTTSYGVESKYAMPQYLDKGRFLGYETVQTIEIAFTGIEALSEAIAGSSKINGILVDSVYFAYSKMDDLREKALKKAMVSAYRKAEALVGNGNVGKTMSVVENGLSGYGSWIPEGPPGTSPQIPLFPGTNSIRVMIKVTFQIK